MPGAQLKATSPAPSGALPAVAPADRANRPSQQPSTSARASLGSLANMLQSTRARSKSRSRTGGEKAEPVPQVPPLPSKPSSKRNPLARRSAAVSNQVKSVAPAPASQPSTPILPVKGRRRWNDTRELSLIRAELSASNPITPNSHPVTAFSSSPFAHGMHDAVDLRAPTDLSRSWAPWMHLAMTSTGNLADSHPLYLNAPGMLSAPTLPRPPRKVSNGGQERDMVTVPASIMIGLETTPYSALPLPGTPYASQPSTPLLEASQGGFPWATSPSSLSSPATSRVHLPQGSSPLTSAHMSPVLAPGEDIHAKPSSTVHMTPRAPVQNRSPQSSFSATSSYSAASSYSTAAVQNATAGGLGPPAVQEPVAQHSTDQRPSHEEQNTARASTESGSWNAPSLEHLPSSHCSHPSDELVLPDISAPYFLGAPGSSEGSPVLIPDTGMAPVPGRLSSDSLAGRVRVADASEKPVPAPTPPKGSKSSQSFTSLSTMPASSVLFKLRARTKSWSKPSRTLPETNNKGPASSQPYKAPETSPVPKPPNPLKAKSSAPTIKSAGPWKWGGKSKVPISPTLTHSPGSSYNTAPSRSTPRLSLPASSSPGYSQPPNNSFGASAWKMFNRAGGKDTVVKSSEPPMPPVGLGVEGVTVPKGIAAGAK